MSEFINYTDIGLSGYDRLHIHLFQHNITILDSLAGDNFEISYLGFGIGSAVSLNNSDNDINALLTQQMTVFQHLISLADTRRSADIDTQSRPLRFFQFGE